jgi:membrane fusion protein (multidrug efflux system)
MHRVSRSVPIYVLACAAVLSACSPHGGDGSQQQAPEVAVVTIQPQEAVLTAELPGRTLPYKVADVRPQVNGILEKRLFVEGSLVKAGEPLYQIDDTLYQAAYGSAKAQLANAKAALVTAKLKADRYVSLREQKSISQQDYDDAHAALLQALANVEQQQANLDTARIKLGYTRITAPITGRIGRSYLTQGALVEANQDQALATIQTLDPIYVDMNQSAGELLALRRAVMHGQETAAPTTADVTLTLDDDTQYPLQGTLQFHEVSVDPTTGTVTLRAQFPNPDGVLLPGMFVRARIVEGVERNALLVPQRGVSRDPLGNATTLIVDADGIVQSRTLTVVQMVGTNWLVRDGINPGDRVIVEGLQYARPGQKANAVAFVSPGESASAAAAAAK